MPFHITTKQRRPVVLAAAAVTSVLLFGSGLAPSAQAPTQDVVITIFPDHYVLAGHGIDDLDVLEAAVSSMRPRSVRLDACGREADRPQRAAAHRLRNRYLQLAFLDPDAPECRAAADIREISTSERQGERPFGIDDVAVDRWWHDLMP